MQNLARDLRAISLALIWLVVTLAAGSAVRPEVGKPTEVAFPTSDGGEVHALLYGEGDQAVVLAHGKVFDKESWAPLAEPLAQAGLRVLAIDFRGYGLSQPGSEGQKLFLDLVAAMSFLKTQGASRISLLGASMGGGAAARAAVLISPGEIDRLILLAPAAIPKPEEMHANKTVYITTEDDPSVDRTRKQYELAAEPKSLEILPGDAHAQHIFKTDQSDALVDLVLAALTN